MIYDITGAQKEFQVFFEAVYISVYIYNSTVFRQWTDRILF